MREIYKYLANDHVRLDGLLKHSAASPEAVDTEMFTEFRRGLLRHIGIEEKIVLPAIARFQNGTQAEIAGRLRLDHGALVALLVPTPSQAIIKTIVSILEVHNALEEKEDGLYQLIDKLAGEETDDLLEEIKNYPEVPMNPYNDHHGVLDVARRAVERAGYKSLF